MSDEPTYFEGDRTAGNTPKNLFAVRVKNKENGVFAEDGKKPRLKTELTLHKTKDAAQVHYKSAQRWLYDDESVELLVSPLEFDVLDKTNGPLVRA